MFSPNVIEKLDYYVYLYINPINDQIFYVGKGKGNRVFSHLLDQSETHKVEIINKLRSIGKEPKIEILIHGIQDEITALRIESAVIDLIGVKNLTNRMRGWGSAFVGRSEVNQLIALYDSQPVMISEPVILIRINQLFRYGMTADELYEATRGVWKVGTRRNQVEYAFTVFQGVVQEVYRVSGWHPAGTYHYRYRPMDEVKIPGRWEFEGLIAEESVRSKYLDKSVREYFGKRSQNPIMYVNC